MKTQLRKVKGFSPAGKQWYIAWTDVDGDCCIYWFYSFDSALVGLNKLLNLKQFRKTL